MQSALEIVVEVKEKTIFYSTMTPPSSSLPQPYTSTDPQHMADTSDSEHPAVGLEANLASFAYDQTLTEISSADTPLTEITIPDGTEEKIPAFNTVRLTNRAQNPAVRVPIDTTQGLAPYSNVEHIDTVELDITLDNPYQPPNFPSYSLERPPLDFQYEALPTYATRRDDDEDSGVYTLHYSSARSFDGSEFSDLPSEDSYEDKSRQLLEWFSGLSKTTLSLEEIVEQAQW